MCIMCILYFVLYRNFISIICSTKLLSYPAVLHQILGGCTYILFV